jgi:glycosyltransferase involved in cell wall biosynthesis
MTAGPGYVLVTGDFVTTGGMDRANHALAAYLLGQGREVHLVAHRAAAELTSAPGAVFHRVPKPLGSYFLGAPLLAREGRKVARRLASRAARVVVNGGNCRWGDVNWVHYVHAAWPPQPAGGPLRRLKGVLARRAELAAERACVRAARVVITNSERTRADVIERLGADPQRVHTVYYGTDPARFRPPTDAERAEARARLGRSDDRPSVVFVGALGDRRKGLDTLLSAWRLLARDPGWDARLAVVGTGAALESLRAECHDLGGSVELLGFRSDVPEILRACDLLVSPTRYEAYGLNVQEALCAGLPALVTRSAGVAEKFPESLQSLLLPDPDDAADLAARLRGWRDRRGEASAAVRGLSESLRSYTWDDMAARIVGLVEHAPVKGNTV